MIHLFNTQNGIRLIINNTEYDAFIYKNESVVAHDDPWDIKTEEIWNVDAKDFPQNFRLSTSFKERINPYVDIVRLENSADSRVINLVSDYIASKWEHPCNIKHYLNLFKGIVEKEYPDIKLTDYYESFEGFFGFNLIFPLPETGTIKDIIVDLVSIYEEIQSNALSLLTSSSTKYPLQVSLILPEHKVHAHTKCYKELAMNPKAFVSYSWDSDEHKKFVATIAAKLRCDGVETILDQWHLVPGDQLPEFMEREIRENDYALIMCTPKYKSKSDARLGGVGYEGDIMTAEVFAKGNHKKFIPILVAGKWINSAPSWLVGKYYIDLSSPEKFEQGYRDLITTIHGHRPKAPPVGNKPTFLTREDVAGQPSVPEYENIYIEGIVVDEVTTPRLDGSRGSALYKVPFKLSRQPSSLWANHFVQAWDRPSKFTTMHRPGIANVIGNKIYLDGTTIEEVEKYHRDTLILSVEVANREESAAIIRKAELANAEQTRRKEHEESVRIAASKIKF